MSVVNDYLTPPEGWYFAAFPWHAMDDIPELPKLVPVGPIFLPEFFHLVIATTETWTKKESAPTDYSNLESVAHLFLNFQVYEDQVQMLEATTAWSDIAATFEQVSKMVPSNRWKSIGINYMTRYLTRFMEEGERPDVRPGRAPGWHWPDEHRGASPYDFRPKEALAWLDKLQERAAEAYATARDRPSPRKKRTRITDEFLREVTNVYRMAENSELPPTREVANYFKSPHSTAAKWVAAARKNGLLPPAAAASNVAARAAAKTTTTRTEAVSPIDRRIQQIQEDLQKMNRVADTLEMGSREAVSLQGAVDRLRQELVSLGGQPPEEQTDQE